MISFNADTHTYTNINTGEVYTSVTKFISQFKSQFDLEGISERVAAREGVKKEAVIERWSADNKTAQDYGTLIHGIIETYLKTGIVADTAYTDMLDNLAKFGDFREKHGCLNEYITHNHQYKIAGTADLINPIGRYFDVFDFKTNKVINYYSKYDNFLKYPLNHLMDCEYNTYALQLSMYAYFYHLITGRIPRRLGVLYLHKKTHDFEFIPVNYLQSDVKRLLETTI